MKQVVLKQSVAESIAVIKTSLQEKGFTIFNDIDHQANAQSVDLELPESRVLIFGNPTAGTKLMQTDITMSLDLPIRLAVVDKEGQTVLIHQTPACYSRNYQVENHPVLEKIETLFNTLVTELNT